MRMHFSLKLGQTDNEFQSKTYPSFPLVEVNIPLFMFMQYLWLEYLATSKFTHTQSALSNKFTLFAN